MKFKVGDKVRIKSDLVVGDYERENNGVLDFIEDMEEYVGMEATITHVYEGSGNYDLDVDDGEYFWSIGMLEEVEEFKFKVGQVVAIREDLSEDVKYKRDNGSTQDVSEDMVEYAGRKAIIVGTTGYGDYLLDIDGGRWKWALDMLQPVDNEYKFKVGDTAKIIEVPSNKDGHYEVRMNKDGEHWVALEQDLELVKEVEELKQVGEFKIGDRVTVLSTLGVPHRVCIGDTGVLVNQVSDIEYEIKMDKDGRVWYIYSEDMQALEGAKVKVETPKKSTPIIKSDSIATYIKVGDVTIAIPLNCPVGISFRHPDDEDNPEVGQGVALKRMIEDGGKKGLF